MKEFKPKQVRRPKSVKETRTPEEEEKLRQKREYNRKYREMNKEKIQEYYRDYQKSHKADIYRNNRKYYYRLRKKVTMINDLISKISSTSPEILELTLQLKNV